MKQTLYDILEVAPDASFEDIEVAYTRRFEVLRTETSWDSNRLVMLNEAREVLSDAGRRAAYDGSLAKPAHPEARLQSMEIEDAPRSSTRWILVGVVLAAIVIWWTMRDDAPPGGPTMTEAPSDDAQLEPDFEAPADAAQPDTTVVELQDAPSPGFDSPSAEVDATPAPATSDAASAAAAAPAARGPIVGYWDCFEPVTGRTSEYAFGADGKLTIRQANGEAESYAYEVANSRVNLIDTDPPRTIGVEELAARKLILSASGAAQRVVCAR